MRTILVMLYWLGAVAPFEYKTIAANMGIYASGVNELIVNTNLR